MVQTLVSPAILIRPVADIAERDRVSLSSVDDEGDAALAARDEPLALLSSLALRTVPTLIRAHRNRLLGMAAPASRHPPRSLMSMS